MEERRKHKRFDVALNGEFHIRGTGIRGILETQNISQGGLFARLNRDVRRDDVLDCELTFPETVVPLFVSARVVWQRHSAQPEAGVTLMEIDAVERQFLVDYSFKKWNQDRKNTQYTAAPLDL